MQYRQSCPVRDKIMRRYDQKLLGAPLWCMTQQEEGLWIQGVNAMVPRRRVFVCASELALDENLSHQHKGAVYHRGRSLSASTSESHGGGRDHVNDQELLAAPPRYDQSSWRVGLLQCSHSFKGARQVKGQSRVVERGEEAMTSPGGLSYPKVKHRLVRRWTRRSTTVPQRRIYRSRRKGCRCKSIDSRAMGLAAPWYCRGGTFVESSIPWSHEGRALVVKGAEEVENAKANSKYQDRAEGQRPRNFIRLVSMGFSSR
ncbi:hypothetical protein GW17_00057112 [Ensete ventricosum]|nr:hypothetical protein GW17_00057112 [Ensete ventricosum]